MLAAAVTQKVACGMNLIMNPRSQIGSESRNDMVCALSSLNLQLKRARIVLPLVVAALIGCRERGVAAGGETTLARDTTARAIANPGSPAISAPVTKEASRPSVGTPARPSTAPTPPAAASTGAMDSSRVRHDSTASASTTTAPSATVTQAPGTPTPIPAPPPAPSALALALGRLPFGNNERLEYQVKYGFLGVGAAVLEVLGLDTVRGTPAIHAAFSVQGGIRLYRVNDRYESWFDPASFSTLRAVHDIDEGSYDRKRSFEFFPDRKMMIENDKPAAPTVVDPLDEASFLFFLRSIPLEVGQTYEFTRYFRPDKNPVRVVVLRKETIKVPAGQFSTIVVRPIIKTTGIFGEGGRAEVWFADDSTRTLVQLKSQLKFGSLNLYLRNRRPGTAWPGAVTVATPAR